MGERAGRECLSVLEEKEEEENSRTAAAAAAAVECLSPRIRELSAFQREFENK